MPPTTSRDFQRAAAHRYIAAEVLLGHTLCLDARYLGILRDQGVTVPLQLGKRIRRFDWSTSLRYETGRRDLGETRGFLKTAKAVSDWVEEQLQ